MKPKQDLDQTRNKAKMNGQTTFNSDYQAHEVARRACRQREEYKPMPGDIDLGTTYTQAYNPYELQPFVPARPKERSHTTNAKLDTVPTYKDDFRPWDSCRRELIKPGHSYQSPSAKFDHSTTFRDEYVPRALAPRESFKPSNVAKPSDIPFDGVTSNQLSFVPHPLEPRFHRAPDTYKPSSQPIQDLTVHRQDFQGLPGEVPQSCKPNPDTFTSRSADLPFHGNTENKDNFQVWPLSPPHQRKKEEYVSPTAQMDLSTTTAAAYVGHHVQPHVSVRPYAPLKRSSAAFQSSTTMREDYQAWANHSRQPIVKKTEEMHKPSGKIEDLTTFRAHFQAHDLSPRASFKPSNQPMRAEARMEDSTMYRSEFLPKRIDVCPASFPSPPGFVFESSDERGHKFFRKLSSKA